MFYDEILDAFLRTSLKMKKIPETSQIPPIKIFGISIIYYVNYQKYIYVGNDST